MRRAPAGAGARLDLSLCQAGRARSIAVVRTEQRTDQRNIAHAGMMLPHGRPVAIDLDRPAFDDLAVRHAIADARLAMARAGCGATLYRAVGHAIADARLTMAGAGRGAALHRAVGHAIADARLAMAGAGRGAALLD